MRAASSAWRRCARWRWLSRTSPVGWLAGEGEEHLIEGGAAQPQVVDIDIEAVDRRRGRCERGPSVADRYGDAGAGWVEPRLVAVEWPQRPGQRLAERRQVAGAVGTDLDDIPPREGLQLGR